MTPQDTKLLAGVEMPEPVGYVWCDYGDLDGAVIRPKGYYTRRQELPLYSADQLQQYAAAAAAQAREKALEDAKQAAAFACEVSDVIPIVAAIEKLKGGE